MSDSEEGTLPSPESDEEMPGWMRDLGATLTPEERPESDSLDEPAEIPAWLRDLRASIPAESRLEMERTAEREEDREPRAELPSVPEHQRPVPAPSEIRETKDRAPELEELAVPLPENEEEPDWLAELRSAAEARGSSTPDLPETEHHEEMPDWLARLQPAASDTPQEKTKPATSTAPGGAPGVDDEAGPQWLDIDSLSEEEQDLESEMPAFDASDEDSLDWLAELIPPPAETGARATKPTPEPGEGELPDWLMELDGSPQERKKKPQPWAADAESADIPAWLEEAPTPEAEAQPESEDERPTWDAQDEEEPIGELPDQDFPFPPLSIEAEEASEFRDEAEDTELSEWLAELRPPISELEAEPSALVMEDQTEVGEEQPVELLEGIEPGTAPVALEEELPGAEVPEWLAELQPAGIEEAQAPSEVEGAAAEIELAGEIVPLEPVTEEGELERADIPAWLLALKPREFREEGEAAETPPRMEGIEADTGLLAGLQGTLPVEMIIAQPRAVTAARALEVSIAETDHTRLFRDIVGRVPEAAPRQIVRAPAQKPAMLPRWLLYLALIVVVAVPLFLREPLFIRTIEPSQATADLYNAIEALPGDATVLVAFDYDPTTSGEMEIIGQALVSHVMDRGARVIAMSLLPAGPAIAQPLLEDLAAARPDYADSYGQQYVNLGYLPGQEAAVRLVGQSPRQAFEVDFQGTPLADLPVMEGVTSAEDFDLILELAAKQDSVRWWVEQASVPYKVPLGAGVSAPIAPLAQPYYETDPRQLVGQIGGVAGAVTYEALQSQEGSLAQSTVSRLDSQMAGQLLLVLVLLIGNGIFLVQRGARR